MASSTRNHVIKRDIQGTLLSRIATNALIPPRYDALFYELLNGLDLPNIPTHKQMAAILFAACSCNIICLTDCRAVMTEPDFQERLVQAQGLDDLYTQFYKLFDKLHAGQTKERVKDSEEEQTSIGETLQHLLSQHSQNDTGPNDH